MSVCTAAAAPPGMAASARVQQHWRQAARSSGAAGSGGGRSHLSRARPSASPPSSSSPSSPSSSSPTLSSPLHPPPRADVDWNDMGFGLVETDFIATAKCDGSSGVWAQPELTPYGPLALHPAAGVLNYGQGLFEGLKARRIGGAAEDAQGSEDIVLFRPSANARRMRDGAARMSIPPPPVDLFLNAVKMVVAANARWVPPATQGTLYVRPLLIGSGPVLGLAPAPEFSLVVYTSPVASYFKGGQMEPIRLKIETSMHRAGPGGTGGVKVIGNYAPVLVAQSAAKEQGFNDIIYLDAVNRNFIEEVSSCNIFVVRGKNIATAGLEQGTILPGITRDSVIQLARDMGFSVEERQVSVEEVLNADEVFCCGTAVVVSAVGSITHEGVEHTFNQGKVGPVSQRMFDSLTSIQEGQAEDKNSWNVVVPPAYHI